MTIAIAISDEFF